MPLNDATDLEGMRGWDLCLSFGKHFEEEVDKMFTGETKVEVKTEIDKWKQYGNIVIELESNGKPSGLNVTEAEVWIHLLSYKGRLVGGFIIPTEKLKQIVNKMMDDKVGRVTKGGDGYKSKLFLLPLNKLNQYFKKVADD
jgi:hypothetical protein